MKVMAEVEPDGPKMVLLDAAVAGAEMEQMVVPR